MRNLIIILLLFFSFTGSAYSYNESQRLDCISSALNNPATKEISKNKINKYCECVLDAIIDQNKAIRESGYECAQKNFS
tara:strand:- start:18 stop:254 length:237 start_codon:yes stop_codon:yes gene_type:complete